MKLFIPELGTRLQLTADWEFTLWREHRNEPLIKALGMQMGARWNNPSYGEPMGNVVLPAGVELVVDRIYIRQGASDFDSVTLRIGKSTPEKTLRGKRFWAKLDDANKIECEVITEEISK